MIETTDTTVIEKNARDIQIGDILVGVKGGRTIVNHTSQGNTTSEIFTEFGVVKCGNLYPLMVEVPLTPEMRFASVLNAYFVCLKDAEIQTLIRMMKDEGLL